MMIAKEHHWLDRENEEAEVLASDGVWACKAYSLPCQFSESQEVKWLACLQCSEIVSSEAHEFALTRLVQKPYGYEIIGQIIDAKDGLVGVGGLIFLVDQSIPGDLSDGDWVQFTSQRVSC